MDWMNRGTRPNPTTNQATAAPAASGNNRKHNGKWGSFVKYTSVVLLFAGTILVVALLFSLFFANDNKESKYVNKNQIQAVFLNGGQVYFGHIGNLTPEYISMSNIYYLRVNQQVQPDQSTNKTTSNDISLVKLGCELHGPVDQMVINRDQVLFWENLKGDGQVAKAVEAYIKNNPNGQKCDTSNSTSSNSTTTDTSTTKKQ